MILYIRDLKALKGVKTVVFDVDGVLVDVRSSFRKMIILACNYYFKLKHGLKGKGNLVTNPVIEEFKRMGGFNNDWDLASALVFLYLNIYYLKNMPSTFEELKLKPEELKKLSKALHENAKRPGYEGFVESTAKYFKCSKALKNMDRKFVEDICKILYAGKNAESVYSLATSSIEEKQLYKFELFKREKPLLEEKNLLQELNYGVVTGRTREELFLLEKKFPVLFKKAVHIVYDDGRLPKKPDPLVLEPLIRGESLPLIFAGDSRDDLETVLNVRKYFKTEGVYFAGIIRDKSGFNYFYELGADIITNNVNMLMMAVS